VSYPTTHVIVEGRALRINFPLSVLKAEDISLEAKNEVLKEFLREKKPRRYEEPTFMGVECRNERNARYPALLEPNGKCWIGSKWALQTRPTTSLAELRTMMPVWLPLAL
jgi:hypothetical protein